MQLLPGPVPLLQLEICGCQPHCCLKADYQIGFQFLLSCNTKKILWTIHAYKRSCYLNNHFLKTHLAICSSAWQCALIFWVSSESILRAVMHRCLKACRRSSLRWLSSTWAQVWVTDCSVSK